MSMITEQVKALKEHADYMQEIGHLFTASIIRHAVETIEQLAAKVRKENGFIFPENPTNGDMIKALFPREYEVLPVNIDRASWWNAPYKRGGANEIEK